jgi:competence protein ComEA
MSAPPVRPPDDYPRLQPPDPTQLRLPVGAQPGRPGRHRQLLLRAGTMARSAVADRLPLRLRTARLTPARRAVVGLLAVMLAVSAVLGVRLAIASATAKPVPVSATSPTSRSTTASTASGDPALGPGDVPTGSTTAGAAPTASPAVVVVDVAGRVRHPLVARLPAGSRVQDALKAAGGALPGSDLVGLNLAALLSDGEQVVVAARGQGSTVNGSGGGGAPGAAGGGGSPTQVDLNTADVTSLDSLPGVGPVLAQRILDWRTAHGHFSSVDELDEVSGIGDKLMAEIRPHVRL